MKVAELKARCKAVSVSMSGCKADLVARLKAFAAGKIPTLTQERDLESTLTNLNRQLQAQHFDDLRAAEARYSRDIPRGAIKRMARWGCDKQPEKKARQPVSKD